MMNNPLMQQPQQVQQQNPLGGAQPALPPGFDIDDALHHNEAMADTLTRLLGSPSLSGKDVLQALVDSANNKNISFQQAAQAATSMPPDDGLKPWLMQFLQQNIQVGKQLHMHKGAANAR